MLADTKILDTFLKIIGSGGFLFAIFFLGYLIFSLKREILEKLEQYVRRQERLEAKHEKLEEKHDKMREWMFQIEREFVRRDEFINLLSAITQKLEQIEERIQGIWEYIASKEKRER